MISNDDQHSFDASGAIYPYEAASGLRAVLD